MKFPLRWILATAWVSLAALVSPLTACAGLVFEVTPASVVKQPGDLGSFDVVLRNTSTTDSFQVSTYDLFFNGSTGVTFLTETMSTAGLGYIFVDPIVDQSGFGPFVISSGPQSFHVGDSEFATDGYRTLSPGDVYGLVHVTYQVDNPTSINRIELTVGGDSMVVNLDSEDLGATSLNGEILVSAVVVPEPSTLALAGTAFAVGGLAIKLRRRRA